MSYDEEYKRKGKKRMRLTPYKKWTDQENNIILDYIRRSSNFELPCAQTYYRQMIKLTGLDTEWSLLRGKVRNMRTAMRKANDWRKSYECELLNGPDREYIIERHLSSICPYYTKLTEVFGEEYTNKKPTTHNITDGPVEFENAESNLSLSMITDDPDSSSQYLSDNPIAITPEPQKQDRDNIDIECPQKSDVKSCEEYRVQQAVAQTIKVELGSAESLVQHGEKQKLENSYSAEHAQELEFKRIDLQKIRIEFEREKLKMEMEMQQKRLKLEEEKLKVKQRWQDKEFELKRLEIEVNERIAMYEIDKKHKLK